MKIILDAEGGDKAPQSVVEGAMLALSSYKDLEIILTGREEILSPLIKDSPNKHRLSILPSYDIISNEDSPTKAVREKKDSSMVVALNALKKNDDIKGMISAGNTGALLTGSFMLVGRIKGISRPALAPVMPTIAGGKAIMMDSGANIDCKSVNLLHFAIMGNYYAESVLKINSPKIGLLSNGTEDNKGSVLNLQAFDLLKNSGLNFIGNVEGRDILSGNVDITVTDGFVGNIALKSMEGMANNIFSLLKQGIMGSGLKGKLGYFLLKDTFKSIKSKMDYNSVGGAAFLGVEKPVIKAHGSSGSQAICSAIRQAIDMINYDVIDKIKAAIKADMVDNEG